MSNENHKLAVVVPAFKADFLARSLASLARQTDQRFSIYVFDDASPADLKSITAAALGNRAHRFKRFEKNLGGVSLPQHWNRCLAEVNEPWVWLFSDDDVMDENCVAEFYRQIEADENGADIWRFDARVIDEADRVVGLHSRNVESETWLEFSYGRLMDWRPSFLQQQIFRREVLANAGGFTDWPLAWYVDDALVIAMSSQKPIRRIPHAQVGWRRSGQNITPDRALRVRREKLRAACLFARWLHARLQAPREKLFAEDDSVFRAALDRFLVEQIFIEGARPALANWDLLRRTRAEFGVGSSMALFRHVAVAALNDFFSAVGSWWQR
jgi:Glycosyl transferase family 2